MIEIMSFGFKYGRPQGGHMVFDCRDLPNPHNVPALKALTGKDEKVKLMVCAHPESGTILDRAVMAAGNGIEKIAFGCIGGRHRSVAMAELLADILKRVNYEVRVVHRELEILCH